MFLYIFKKTAQTPLNYPQKCIIIYANDRDKAKFFVIDDKKYYCFGLCVNDLSQFY